MQTDYNKTTHENLKKVALQLIREGRSGDLCDLVLNNKYTISHNNKVREVSYLMHDGSAFFSEALKYEHEVVCVLLLRDFLLNGEEFERFANQFSYANKFKTIQHVFPHIDAIYSKIDDLTERNFDYEAGCLRACIHEIKSNLTVYLTTEMLTYDQLVNNCKEEISKSMPEVSNQRGYKKPVSDFLKAILKEDKLRGLSQFFTGSPLFLEQTDSVIVLEKFEKNL